MAVAPTLESTRLCYRRLSRENLETFHRLAVDPHIRVYIMDGVVVERSVTDTILVASEALFAERQVGLWLIYEADEEDVEEAIGFAGFHVFEEPISEPQILYAFTRTHTGRGYATEVAQALLENVEALGWDRVAAAVDEPNTASVRVLQKLGFAQMFTYSGVLGRCLYFSKSFTQPLPDAAIVRGLLETSVPKSSYEILETLVAREGVRIERIVSTGQRTADETWYEQDEHEWVILLQGAARLEYGDGEIVTLEAGDSLLLPAGRKHRVHWTEPDATTVWLAVFFR